MVARQPYVGRPSLGLAEDALAAVLDLIECAWQTAKMYLNATSQETQIAGRLGGEMIREKKRRKISHFRIEEEGNRSRLFRQE